MFKTVGTFVLAIIEFRFLVISPECAMPLLADH